MSSVRIVLRSRQLVTASSWLRAMSTARFSKTRAARCYVPVRTGTKRRVEHNSRGKSLGPIFSSSTYGRKAHDITRMQKNATREAPTTVFVRHLDVTCNMNASIRRPVSGLLPRPLFSRITPRLTLHSKRRVIRALTHHPPGDMRYQPESEPTRTARRLACHTQSMAGAVSM